MEKYKTNFFFFALKNSTQVSYYYLFCYSYWLQLSNKKY
jgi:hypothetical protein